VNPDSSVVRAAVKLGTRLAADVEVTEGLQDGQTVIRAGHQKLFDGAKVMPVPHQDGTAPAAGGAAGSTNAEQPVEAGDAAHDAGEAQH
jgi:membrane fusion protein (multidrug efflux system)